MRKRAGILVVGGALACTAVAFAAGLPITSGVVGSGTGAVAACDPDGFTIAYTTSSGNVTSATVGGILEPACVGGSLSLTLVDAAGASVGSGGPVAVPNVGNPGSVAVAISPQPAASVVAGMRVTIAGP